MNLTGNMNYAFLLRNISVNLRRWHELPDMRMFDSIHSHMIRTANLVEYFKDEIMEKFPGIDITKMSFQMAFHDFHEVLPPYDLSLRAKMEAQPEQLKLWHDMERGNIDFLYKCVIRLSGDDENLAHKWMVDMHEKKSIEAKIGKFFDLVDAGNVAYLELKLGNGYFLEPFLLYAQEHLPNFKYYNDVKPLFEDISSSIFNLREYRLEALRIRRNMGGNVDLPSQYLLSDTFSPFDEWHDINKDWIGYTES